MTSRAALRRLFLTIALVSAGAVLTVPGDATTARGEPTLTATPQRACGPGSRPETSIQGRVPRRDYDSGRAQRGYQCNAWRVGRLGQAGGFKVFRYTDAAGRRCVFYDSTRFAPTDLPYNLAQGGLGTIVVDVTRADRMRQTAVLQTGANLSPHESLYLNRERGLLAAVVGNAATAPGVLDIYSVRANCRQPVLRSSTPFLGFGHESGFAPDGRTFYSAGAASNSMTAFDVSNPAAPRQLTTVTDVVYHGLRLSSDGNVMYVANIDRPTPGGRIATGGLRILDVSDIQARRPNPQVRTLSDLSWRQKSIPQHADPIIIGGHRYLLETDEFANNTIGPGIIVDGGYEADAPVGAARLINIDNRRNPYVVSNLRLAVHQLKNRAGPQRNDPGAQNPVTGYAGHYCSAPRKVDPGIVACSMIGSGLRVFDVRRPGRPVEVAYFNRVTYPGTRQSEGATAMSAPAWDLKRRLVYYSDGQKGLFAVRLAKAVVPRHYWQ